VTTPYRIGRDVEDRVVKDAFAHGCIAQRGPGSKGFADVIVFAPGPLRGWAVNVKRGSWPGPDERRDFVLVADYGLVPVLVRADLTTSRTLLWQWRILDSSGGMSPLVRAPWDPGT